MVLMRGVNWEAAVNITYGGLCLLAGAYKMSDAERQVLLPRVATLHFFTFLCSAVP
jgi:hypothetical protein